MEYEVVELNMPIMHLRFGIRHNRPGGKVAHFVCYCTTQADADIVAESLNGRKYRHQPEETNVRSRTGR